MVIISDSRNKFDPILVVHLHPHSATRRHLFFFFLRLNPRVTEDTGGYFGHHFVVGAMYLGLNSMVGSWVFYRLSLVQNAHLKRDMHNEVNQGRSGFTLETLERGYNYGSKLDNK